MLLTIKCLIGSKCLVNIDLCKRRSSRIDRLNWERRERSIYRHNRWGFLRPSFQSPRCLLTVFQVQLSEIFYRYVCIVLQQDSSIIENATKNKIVFWNAANQYTFVEMNLNVRIEHRISWLANFALLIGRMIIKNMTHFFWHICSKLFLLMHIITSFVLPPQLFSQWYFYHFLLQRYKTDVQEQAYLRLRCSRKNLWVTFYL